MVKGVHRVSTGSGKVNGAVTAPKSLLGRLVCFVLRWGILFFVFRRYFKGIGGWNSLVRF